MDEKRVGVITSIISAFVVMVFAIIKEAVGLQKEIFFTVIGIMGGIILLVCIYFVIRWNRLYKYRHNLVDTSSVLERSRRVAKDIKRVAKAAERTIEKFVRENDTLTEERKVQIKEVKASLKGINLIEVNKVATEISYFADLKAKETVHGIESLSHSQQDIYKLNHTILNSIHETQRALLVLEQYDTRIYLGDYVLKHSSEPLERASAYIDLKGWTYSLLGKTKLFKESVKMGIEALEKYLASKDLSPKQEKDAILKLARAHRHLGSDIIVARKSSKAAIEENEAGRKVLTDHFLEKEIESDEEIQEMMVGIEYGILNAHYFEISSRRVKDRSETLVDELLGYIEQTRKLIAKSKNFKNPHRLLKCILLENEFLKILETTTTKDIVIDKQNQYDSLFGKVSDIRKEICRCFDNNTSEADKVFKRAIYADEMMENYINQEATQLFRLIKEISQK